MTSKQPASQNSVWSLAAFWVVAFIGAGLFAAVLLAPKWERRQMLRAQVLYHSQQCAYLHELNDHLRWAIEGLKNNPEFTADVARSSLGSLAPGEERLPAPIRPRNRPVPTSIDQAPPHPLDPFVRLFSQDPIVRRVALATAAVFIVVGLAFFNARSTERDA